MIHNIVKRRARKRARKHEAYLEDIAPKAKKIMNDKRLNFFRTQIRRRVLASAILFAGFWTMFLMVTEGFSFGKLYPSIYGMYVYGPLVFFGSRVARGFMQLPQDLLDERIIHRRLESYKYAFSLAGTILLLSIPVLMAGRVTPMWFPAEMTGRTIDPYGMIIGFFFFICGLPLAVFLWREPEL